MGAPAGHDFGTTHWSVLRAAAARSPEALEELCRAYWPPLYAFVRRRGHGPEDALDLTQGFFASLLARDDLAGLDPAEGRFRAWLLRAAQHFLANERARERALKRGGGARPLPLDLDLDEAESRCSIEPADERSPEAWFERQWALALLDRVLARLRAEQERKGRAAIFERLRGFLTADDDAGSQGAAAAELGLGAGAVKVAVHRLRRRYRELLVEEVARTVDRPQDVEDELRQLLAALGA